MARASSIVKLQTAEVIALADWIRARKLQLGDTYKSLAQLARIDLKNDRINDNHIRGQMDALQIQLPKGEPVIAGRIAARLDLLEHKLNTVLREQMRLCREYGVEPSIALTQLIAALDEF